MTSAAAEGPVGTVPLVIVHDFFPASVKANGQRLATARVAVDGAGRAVVLVATGRGAVVSTHASGQTVSVERASDRSSRTWLLTLTDGTVWECRVGGGCGCGNPLRRFDPEPAIHEAFAGVEA